MPDFDIRPVTAKNWDDFAGLFEARGGPHYCWCSIHRFPVGHRRSNAEKKRGIHRLVKNAIPIGVLAYAGDVPVGWCSIAPRETYAKLERSRTMPRVTAAETPTWTVLCFFVPRPHRGGGVAHALLQGAIAYARAQGARVVEGYPFDSAGISSTHRGHSNVFKDAGFAATGAGGFSSWIRPDRLMATIEVLVHQGNIPRLTVRYSAVWTVIALSVSACATGRALEVRHFEQCKPPAVDREHPFYPADAIYVDASPIAWETAAPGEMGLDAARLEAAADEAGLSDNLASMLVIRHGKLVFERYFNGSDVSQANNVHSLSKSILSVVTGIAISEGLLELDASIADILPPDLVGANGDLTVRNLLAMSGGLELKEDEGEYDWEYTEEEGEPSIVRAVLERPRIAAPGEEFAYSTGLSQVLSAVITESAGGSSCDFAYDRLFAPLGIDVDYWHVHPDGYHAGGDSMFLTPREVARFGQLVLQGGAWEGEQLVPAEWLAESLEVVWDLECRPWGSGYGYLWWLEEVGGNQVWTASGYGGQDLHIVPTSTLCWS
jgi:CubicO group peptidase (beta-lactamase class C family)/GNAT superfamily N-acetyltransferase